MKARLHTWQSRLADAMAAHREQPWVRGPAADCCGFAGACVEAITGADPLVGWGQWSTTREAQRILRPHGSLRAAVGTQLGAEVHIGLVQPGDIGLFADLEGDGLAVWGGAAWFAPGRAGLVTIAPEAIEVAWRCTGEVEHD